MARTKFSVEEKQKIVLYHLKNKNEHQDWTLRKTANFYYVHHQTIKNWVDTYQTKGLEGLIDHRNNKNSFEKGNNSEIIRLNKELKKVEKAKKRLEIENDILKKYQAFLKNQ